MLRRKKINRPEAALIGERPGDALWARAGELAMEESRPIGNVRASAAYRREMVGVLTRRALHRACGMALAEERS